MANITFRQATQVAPGTTTTKNAALTNAEVDGNFVSLNTAITALETTVNSGTGVASKVAKAGDTMTGSLNWSAPPTIASAATVNIGAASSNVVNISGTTTITSFDSIAAGAIRTLVFGGALTLTNNAAIALPGGVNITTAAGDSAEFLSLGAGNWRCVRYTKAAGGLPATLSVSDGGTGTTTSTGSGSLVLQTSPTLITPLLGTPTSGNFSTGTFTWPTFNQNTTGTAAGLSATLAAASGGTGITTYAVGDLVYANTTTTLAKLPDVATGNVLISGGVNTAPSYGKVGLTTHVSGTLPVANGGTGVTTSTGTGAVALNVAPVLTGYKETRIDMGAGNSIDLNAGNYFTKTVSGATTFSTPTNIPAAGTCASFILDLTNGGSATTTWWSPLPKWAGGIAPTLTAAGRDVIGFYTHDGGTTWTGLLLGKDVK